MAKGNEEKAMTTAEFAAALERLDRELDKLETSFRESHRTPGKFVAVDRVIMLGQYCVGRMKSKTYAIRTANALNEYQPNERGR